MNTKIIKFDLNKYKLYENIKAKQKDTKSRFLLFQLLDGSIPFDLTNRSVRAYMIKPDGNEIFNDLIINNYSLGYCTLELTNQVLAVPGKVKIELMITEEDKKLTSSVFELEVIKSINSENSIVSTNEFTALLNGLASLSEYDNYKNEIKNARGGEVKLKDRLDKFGEQLDTNKKKTNKVNKINEIIYKVKIGEYTKFRFIGDSIGLGADATGFGENPDGIITFNWYGDIHREPKRDVMSYVNLFRLCLQNINPSVSLVNSSISGRSVKEASNLRTGYIFNESGEDVVIIALSINDLHMCKTIQEYEESYQIFIDYIKEVTKCKEIILLTPTLVFLENDTSGSNYLKVRDIVNSIIKIAEQNELLYIDLFNMLLNEINRGTINYYTFFNDDTVHPSNEGHYLLYQLLTNVFHQSINDDSFYIERLVRWTTPTLESGITDLSTVANEYDKVKYTVIGKNKIVINGILTGESLNIMNQKLFTLSHVVAPKKYRLFNCIYNTNDGEKKQIPIKIDNQGNVSIYGQIQNCNWLNIDIMYYN